MAAAVKVAEPFRPMRGKVRFIGGEKVLCYEPDPNKAKVVYDAKILEVQASCDDKGRKQNEYLVHFQGWNSSWDRYVLEDMLLKDSEENRALQSELFVEAGELQKKLNKKKKLERRMSEKNRASVDSMDEGSVRERSVDGSLVEDPDDGEIQFTRFKVEADDTVSEADTDTMTEPASSPNKLNLVEELQAVKLDPIKLDEPEDYSIEVIPLPLTEGIKRKLEQDHLMINSKNKLVKLPAQPNIVTLLEMFVRNYAIQRLAALEKQLGKSPYSQYRMTAEKEAEKYDEAGNNINICKEVAEGVRIIMDFQLGNILLYPNEEDQFAKSIQLRPHMENIERQVVGAELPEPPSTQAGIKKTSTSSRKHALSESQPESVEGGKKRNRLSVGKEDCLVQGSGSTSSGTATPTLTLPPGHSSYPQTSKSHAILGQVYSWKLVPETLYFDYPVPASLVYGGVHLARLLVKLPEILAKMRFSTKSCRNIIKYLEYLVEFLTNQQDIFTESNYV